MRLPVFRRRAVAALAAACVLSALGVLLPAAPASAAVLFADDFEQPTYNIWNHGGGGAWAPATDNGNGVWQQSSAAVTTTTAWAGSGSGTGTSVSGRVKALTPLTGTALVAVAGRIANPSAFYYAGLRGGALEVGIHGWSADTVLATAPFAAGAGSWYTIVLNFPSETAVTATVTGPGGATASVAATDPGGPRGTQVGFTMAGAGAALDDIRLSNALPPPPPPAGPCVASLALRVQTDFGYGFIAYLDITNTSPNPIANPWTVGFRLSPGQYVQNVFGATWYEVGPSVSLTGPVYSAPIPPGATRSGTLGFVATSTGPARPVSNATFNGVACPITFTA
jgi:hypothetical protein